MRWFGLKSFSLAAFVLLFTHGAWGAIAFDASSSSSGSTSFSFNHTVGAGTNTALVCFQSSANSGLTTVAISYNGVSMGSPVASNTISATNQVYAFVLVNPAGGTHSVSVTGADTDNIVICSSWTGVNQATPVGNTYSDSTTSGTVTVSPSVSAGSVVVDGLHALGQNSPSGHTLTPDGTQTIINNTATSNNSLGIAGSSYKASATAMSWTISNNSGQNDSLLAIEIKAAGGGGGSTTLMHRVIEP